MDRVSVPPLASMTSEEFAHKLLLSTVPNLGGVASHDKLRTGVKRVVLRKLLYTDVRLDVVVTTGMDGSFDDIVVEGALSSRPRMGMYFT